MADEGGVYESSDGIGGERERGRQGDAEYVDSNTIEAKPALKPAPFLRLVVLGLNRSLLLPATSRRPPAAAAAEASGTGAAVQAWVWGDGEGGGDRRHRRRGRGLHTWCPAEEFVQSSSGVKTVL